MSVSVEVLPGLPGSDRVSPVYPDTVYSFVDHLQGAGVDVAHAAIRPDHVVQTKELSLTLPIIEILASAPISVLTGLIVSYISGRGNLRKTTRVAVEIRVRDDNQGTVTRTIRATGTSQDVVEILKAAGKAQMDD